MRPKVALVSSYDPECGIGVYTYMLATALKERVDVEVIARTKDNPHLDWNSVRVHKVIEVKDSNWPETLAEFVKQEKYDIIHLQHEYALWTDYEDKSKRDFWNKDLVRFLDIPPIPVIMTAHSVYTRQGEHQNWFMREANKRAAKTIVHGYVQRDAMMENLGLTEEEVRRRFEVIPHWAREDVNFNKEECKAEFGLEGLVIGHPTFIQPNKGTLELVQEIWPRVHAKASIDGQRVKLFITGKCRDPAHEEYYNAVKEAITNSPIRASILLREDIHPRNGNEIRRAMSASDLLAWPHIEESTSGSVQMGVECAIPCVGSAIEGMIEQIGGINRIEDGKQICVPSVGIPVKPKKYDRPPAELDYGAFADAVYDLLTNPEKRAEFSRNAKKNVKEWSGLSLVAAKHTEVYKEVSASKIYARSRTQGI